ncbi:hypothetical protein [Actinokineospora cianjurensis]|uniref:Uncharacterized protein n=1 Tax=Actinokineospora cianjurensis TaxID=585224 RepID=A0A421AVT8_9PSEU|nr:hypothetical protein [Actinokineospora cianjurensis]RLK54195.1 hypothetical protein CLV68_6198 [Actinokineospora cianjurensis]
MSDIQIRLMAELRTLRKGRGVHSVDIGARLGPQLRQVCGVTDSDDPGRARHKVISWLRESVNRLQEDLRVAAVAGFALDDTYSRPHYTARLDLAGESLNRDTRTVRRRVDEAIDRIAELAVAEMTAVLGQEPAQWHLRALRVLLVVDGPETEAFETRTVVADGDALTELDFAVTLTATDVRPTQPPVTLLHGGTLLERTAESRDRSRLVLKLSRSLAREETHEFVVRRRVPPGHALRPHYVCLPEHRCDHFELKVHFAADWPRPTRVDRITQAFQNDIEDPDYAGTPAALDEAGDISVWFDRLVVNRAYGLRWWF